MNRIQIQLHASDPIHFDENDPLNFDARIMRWRISGRSHTWRPPTDLIETEDAYIVRVEIAGMNVEDFELDLTDNILRINGTRWEEYPDCAFHQLEISSGDFASIIEIPGPIDTKNIAAVYENGFLHVTLPKAQAKQIKVN